MKYFIALLGALTFISMIGRILSSGIFNNTVFFLGGISISLWVFAIFFDKIVKQRWFYAILGVGLCLSLFFFVLIFTGARTAAPTFNEDFAIVLGAGLRNGDVGDTLARRLDATIRYHQQNPSALIIVSGGIGHRQNYSEAEVMARYLIAHDIPASAIILEEMAYSTYSNMQYSMELISGYITNDTSIVVITSDFHMYRSAGFARRVGFNNISRYPASTPAASAPFAYLREAAAIIKMWVLGI